MTISEGRLELAMGLCGSCRDDGGDLPYCCRQCCLHSAAKSTSPGHLLNSNSTTFFARHKTRHAGLGVARATGSNQVVMPLISFYYPFCLFLLFTTCSLSALFVGGASGQQQPATGDGQYGDAVQPAQLYIQHNNIQKFSVDENAPPGTHVGTIRSNDNQVPSLITVQPLAQEIEFNQKFRVNFTTGDLYTASQLDREAREEYHLIAIVSNPFAEVKCIITLLDVNDNAPMFLTNQGETNYVIEVPEGSLESGKCLRRSLPLAVDLDSFVSKEKDSFTSKTFGIKEFTIKSGNTPGELFRLVEHGAACNTSAASQSLQADPLIAAAAAAAESPQLVQQLKQQATVLIPSQPTVQSLPSLISAAPYAFSGMNATLQQLVASAPSKHLIDIEVSQPLDRENQSSYQLVVEVSDGAEPFNVGRLSVTVNVLDINDNDPIFTSPAYECTVSENYQKGAPVIRVSAHDVDSDQNGRVTYSIKRHVAQSSGQLLNGNLNDNGELAANRYGGGANKQRPAQQAGAGQKSLAGSQRGAGEAQLAADLAPSSPFKVHPNTGEISLASQLDYETDQWHELLIEARDQGRPSRSSTATVRVNVQDAPDDPPPISRPLGDVRAQPAGAVASAADGSRPAESSARSTDYAEQQAQGLSFLNNLHFAQWLAQTNSSALFAIVLVALLAVMFPVCLVKMKSRQPESDYNDTAGLTNQMASGTGQTKPSPSHSASNMEHADGMLAANGALHPHHHDHQRRLSSAGGPFAGMGPGAKMMGRHGHQYHETNSNHYYNLYPAGQRPRHHSSTSHHHLLPESPGEQHHHHGHHHHHQMPPGGSRGGTMTLSHNHHHRHLFDHTPPGHHHSFEHHHHHGHHQPAQFAGANLATGSLTYDHSHAAMLHAAHHHQSMHHLSPLHQVAALNGGHLSKGDTMNSMGTHHSAQHQRSGSPMAATPNTTHSSAAGASMLHGDPGGLLQASRRNPLLPSIPQGASSHHSSCLGQAPTTPTHNPDSLFPWSMPIGVAGPGSTLGCHPGGSSGGGGRAGGADGLHADTPGSTLDSCSSPTGQPATPQPLDRWLDPAGGPPQLVNPQDWCGTYDWDYLDDWRPESHNLMPLIEAEAAAAAAEAAAAGAAATAAAAAEEEEEEEVASAAELPAAATAGPAAESAQVPAATSAPSAITIS